MPRSLHRTWLALAIATFAVLVVAVLTARELVRHVYVECPGSLVSDDVVPRSGLPHQALMLVPFTSELSTAAEGEPSFELKYDEKQSRRKFATSTYENVRVVWRQPGRDGAPCTCGSMPVALRAGERPDHLSLYKSPASATYVVKGAASYAPRGGLTFGGDEGRDLRGTFWLGTTPPVRRLQTDRIFTRRHLPGLVVMVALGALGVALVRSRRAMAYALRMHTWTEATLTPSGLVESETGAALGRLSPARGQFLPPGPILVAPEALSTNGLYRDMPILTRRTVAEGTHARWATGTMVALRDARALAVLSTMCTALAFGAHLLA